jgi:hypothetical protein
MGDRAVRLGNRQLFQIVDKVLACVVVAVVVAVVAVVEGIEHFGAVKAELLVGEKGGMVCVSQASSS